MDLRDKVTGGSGHRAMQIQVLDSASLKRVVTADEVAQAVMAAVTHLTSSTGWVIPVDGGKLVG